MTTDREVMRAAHPPSNLHIHRPSGSYIGQVRHCGAHRWQTVAEGCKSARDAMIAALVHFEGHKRARVLFIDDEGWYGPVQVMECKV